VLGLLAVAGLLAWQLAVAVPAQARAGDLDPSFGTGGKVVTDFAGQLDEAFAVAVQDNGRIVAAGRADESDVSALGDFALARYLPDGSLDPGFGVDGKVKMDFTGAGGDDRVNAVAVQTDGRLVAAGHALDDWALARFMQDGTLDPSFGTGGKVTTGFAGGGTAAGLVAQSDAKLVAAGTADAGTGSGPDFALVRYRPDGSLDPGFGVAGKVTTDFGAGGIDRANALAVQADDRLVAAGSPNNQFGFGPDFALARYLRR